MTACDDCGWQECFTEGRCIGAEAEAPAAVVVSPPVFIGLDLSSRPDIAVGVERQPDGTFRILKFGAPADAR